MKRTLIILIGLLMISTNLYAAGDLIVDGNLGVGTSTPAVKLDVVGQISVHSDYQHLRLLDTRSISPGSYFTAENYSDENGDNPLFVHRYYDANTDTMSDALFTLDPTGRTNIYGGLLITGGDTGMTNKLYVYESVVNDVSARGAFIQNIATVTDNGIYNNQGLKVNLTPVVNTGFTNSGTAIALDVSPLYTSTEDGTLSSQKGIRVFYGNYDNCGGSCGAGTITSAVGLQISPMHDNGIIQSSYGLLINEPTTGAQVGNHWGFYVSGADVNNYIGGNLGIGTNNPAYDLDVSGTIKSYYLYPGLGSGDPYRLLRFGDETTYWAGFMWNNTSATYGDGDDFTIFTYDDRDIVLQPSYGKIVLSPYASSKVGIGTDSPSQKLDVIGNTYISGNVGIGTASPGAKLDVVGDVNVSGVVTADNIITSGTGGIVATGSIRTEGSAAIGSATTSSIDKLYVTTDYNNSTWGRGGSIVNNAYATSDDGYGYYNQGLNIRINPVVNTGVVNSGYAMGLDVNALYTSEEAGTLNQQMGIRVRYGNYNNCGSTCGAATINNAYGIVVAPQFENGTISNSYGLYITEPTTGGIADNNWGIYQASPDMNNYFAGAVGIAGAIDPSYILTVNGIMNATSYGPSDQNLKDDIKTIESPLKKVMDIEGVSFNWKKTEEYKDRHFPEGRHYGVIAQEVEKVLPDIVMDGTNGEKSVNYSELIPVLIEAMKEQQSAIDKQQGEIEKQKTEIDVLKAEIERLKPQKVATR